MSSQQRKDIVSNAPNLHHFERIRGGDPPDNDTVLLLEHHRYSDDTSLTTTDQCVSLHSNQLRMKRDPPGDLHSSTKTTSSNQEQQYHRQFSPEDDITQTTSPKQPVLGTLCVNEDSKQSTERSDIHFEPEECSPHFVSLFVDSESEIDIANDLECSEHECNKNPCDEDHKLVPMNHKSLFFSKVEKDPGFSYSNNETSSASLDLSQSTQTALTSPIGGMCVDDYASYLEAKHSASDQFYSSNFSLTSNTTISGREKSISATIETANTTSNSGLHQLRMDVLRSLTKSAHSMEFQERTERPSKPGAYCVTKFIPPGLLEYEVIVPDECGVGDWFELVDGNRTVAVQCPTDFRREEPVVFQVPKESITIYDPIKPSQLTASPTAEEAWRKHRHRFPNSNSIGGAFFMNDLVRDINNTALRSGQSVSLSHVVKIPQGIAPGELFQVIVDNQTFQAKCPLGARPGQRIRITPPLNSKDKSGPRMQIFEVQVPQGVNAGDQFTATIGKLDVLVECPKGREGMTINVQLPTKAVIREIALAYESQKRTGWRRIVRVSDLKFQWVHMSANSSKISAPAKIVPIFDFFKSAYVRKILFLEGNDPRLHTAHIRLVPAAEATVDSKLRINGKTLVSYNDIAKQQVSSLKQKHAWFVKICREITQLCPLEPSTPLQTGAKVQDTYIEIFVRRDRLLKDSVRGVLSLSVAQMRAPWRIHYMGESALDERGVTKEWFECVTKELLNPGTGLFVGRNERNQAVVDIDVGRNLESVKAKYLYYRFAGRILGRALFTNHQIKGHLVRTLYKHLLGWPLTYEDIREQDETIFMSLKSISSLKTEIPNLALTFTAVEFIDGENKEVELCEGGSEIDVTQENLPQYLEAYLCYRIFGRAVSQLTELLLGFYEVVPESALTIFDTSELEIILCGLPSIDVNDWKANTHYTGLFAERGVEDMVIQWFWDIVEDFGAELLARLLQFATGTSSVPPEGFGGIGGNDSKLAAFTIEGVDVECLYYPKAHTCFNRIDLPQYRSKEVLKQRLLVSITTAFVGFDDS